MAFPIFLLIICSLKFSFSSKQDRIIIGGKIYRNTVLSNREGWVHFINCVREIPCAYFDLSELKDIFHSYAQLEINLRSSLKICLLNTEKISSANSFVVNQRLLPSPFIKIKKKSAPKMDPCGTLAWAASCHSKLLFGIYFSENLVLI